MASMCQTAVSLVLSPAARGVARKSALGIAAACQGAACQPAAAGGTANGAPPAFLPLPASHLAARPFQSLRIGAQALSQPSALAGMGGSLKWLPLGTALVGVALVLSTHLIARSPTGGPQVLAGTAAGNRLPLLAFFWGQGGGGQVRCCCGCGTMRRTSARELGEWRHMRQQAHAQWHWRRWR
jgi:hypothetical protein